MKNHKLKHEYPDNELHRKDLAKNPLDEFSKWYKEAEASELDEFNAATLATCGKDRKPSIRAILLKKFDEKGFVFYTNYHSRKAQEIEENPWVSICFLWLPLHKQVRIEGSIEKSSQRESEEYFKSRPYGSQLGAWVATQSREITSRTELEAKLAEVKKRFEEGQVPLPPHWGGYRIKPETFEFWRGRRNRLHDRFLYTKEGQNWKISRLAP